MAKYSIYLRQPDGGWGEGMETSEPEEAEAHYLGLCRLGRDTVIVESQAPEVVPPAQYQGHEHVPERRLQIWAWPHQGGIGPSHIQVRALLRVLSLTRAGAAEVLGLNRRTIERWCAQNLSLPRIPWPSWYTLMSLARLAPPLPSVDLLALVRDVGGWPIDMIAVAELLERADEVLPGGREHQGALTPEQLEGLGFGAAREDN